MATVENTPVEHTPTIQTTGGGDLQNPGSSPSLARGMSLLDEARKRREERESHLFAEVPSWDGDLIAEYRVLNSKELDIVAENVARKVRSGDKDPIFADLDVIAKSNVGLYMIDPESGERVAIEDENGIVTYGRAAHVLGLEDELKTTIRTIEYLTGEREENGSGWKTNPTAITAHAQRIARWMRDPSKSGRNILEEILGES